MMGENERPSGWIGTILQGKWHIDAKLARGGVATVFRATHRQGQVAAIKILHPEYSRNEDVRRRFLLEGYAANKVGHPGVVRVLDDDVTEDGSAYIVMELLQNGVDLEDRRVNRGGKIPVAEVAQICDQVLDVLAAAHEQGIVHRDIKPENIFVLADDSVKVLDFGIAHIKQALVKHEPTATGLLLGTPDYMSPEQALGVRGRIDAQTDIYALGATMFTLLSGEAVHSYDSLSVLLVATGMRQARSLSSAAFKDIPREVIAVVDKALALEKARRWPTARAMQAALRAAVPGSSRHRAGVKVSVPPPAPVQPPRPAVVEPLELAPVSSPTVVNPPPAPTMPAAEDMDDLPTQTKLAPIARVESVARAVVPATADPWTEEFADGDMEGPTVALGASGSAPALGASPPRVLTKPPLPETPRDKEITQALPRGVGSSPSMPPPPPPPPPQPTVRLGTAPTFAPSYPPPPQPQQQPLAEPSFAPPPWAAAPPPMQPAPPTLGPRLPPIAIAAMGVGALLAFGLLITVILLVLTR